MFITLTKPNKNNTKIRINVNTITVYFQEGEHTMVCMVSGWAESFVETVEEIDMLIEKVGK